jgi:uncharacterized LabA/DUF88 family protein
MPHMDNAYVYLDGAYLQKISKHLGSSEPIKFDIKELANTLAKQNGLWCSKAFFYTAPPYLSSNPTEEEKQRRSNYDRFANAMKKIPDFCFREGRCQKVEGEYNEKGVDTLITMDLMELCRLKTIRNILILTCDTDFVPILNKVRNEFNINVILVYFTDYQRNGIFSMSNHLWTACDKKFLINKSHFDVSGRKKV